MRKKEIISIIGGSYFQPITDVLFVLSKTQCRNDLAVQVSDHENGYSAAACILSAVSFESYAMRIHAVSKTCPRAHREPTVDYLRRRYPEYNWQDLEETFVIRDVLAHNHLWSLNCVLDNDGALHLSSTTKDALSGDRKYRDLVDLDNLRTKSLELNINPIRIDRFDVSKVLTVICEAFRYLENDNQFCCPVSHVPVNYKGQNICFIDLVSSWCDEVAKTSSHP